MTSEAEIPSRKNSPGIVWLFLTIILVLITRIPFLDMGFGRPDAWRVGVSGKMLAEFGEYIPSRPPGFPLLELISALAYRIFGFSPLTWTFTNSLTTIIFCVSVWAIWALAKKWNVPYPNLVAFIYSFAPLNWVYSVETIDYLWMTSLIVLSVLAFESEKISAGKRPVIMGILLGLAASARFFAAFQLIPLGILIWASTKSWKEAGKFLAAFLVTAGIFYSFVLIRVDNFGQYMEWFNSLNAIQSRLTDIKGAGLTRRFIAPAIGLFGPLCSIAVMTGFIAGRKKLVNGWKIRDRKIWVPSLMAIFIMVPYLWHLHPNYWIPATGFIIIILGSINRKTYLLILAMLIFVANIPWWQANIEGLGLIIKPSENAWAKNIAPYQNETFYTEMLVRQMLWAQTEELLAMELPDNAIVMGNIGMPIISFLVDGIRPDEMEFSNGRKIEVWSVPGNEGPYYKYFLSPSQVEDAVNSGYRVFCLPGAETTYYATYRQNLREVEGVEFLAL